MPSRITLDTVLPPLWCGLQIDAAERQRPLTRARFESILTSSETVVSPTVLKRMWDTLARSDYATYSPYSSESVVLDIPAIRMRLYARGMQSLIESHTHHTHTHTEEGAVQ